MPPQEKMPQLCGREMRLAKVNAAMVIHLTIGSAALGDGSGIARFIFAKCAICELVLVQYTA